MEKRFFLECLLHFVVLLAICKVQRAHQFNRYGESGSVSGRMNYFGYDNKWAFIVPDTKYAILRIEMTTKQKMDCSTNYIAIHYANRSDDFLFPKLCYINGTLDPIVLLDSAYVFFVHNEVGINMNYKIYYQRGNEFPLVPGYLEFRKDALSWLLSKRSPTFDWGEDTHRAITALYLSKENASFSNKTWEEDLMIRKLELDTAMELMRYPKRTASLTDISMLTNALILTCYNPRNFNNYDLLEILLERMNTSSSFNPGAYLTLCIADRTPPIQETEKLFMGLKRTSKYPILLDNEALTVMAVACAKKRGYDLTTIPENEEQYKASISRLITDRKKDGSYGNVYTSALVTQALLASGQEFNPSWVWNKTMMYLMKEINSTSDLLTITLALPLFYKKTLLDISNVKCKMPKDGYEISDIMNRPGERMMVRFSMQIDVESGVTHTLYMKVPKTISAFEVLRVARESDHKYRFRYGNFTGNVYVYKLAGKINDAEKQKYWIMYNENIQQNKSAVPISESLDKHAVNDGDHLIMVYTKVPIGTNDMFPNLWSTPFPYTKSNMGLE